jgi:hypothetical protein
MGGCETDTVSVEGADQHQYMQSNVWNIRGCAGLFIPERPVVIRLRLSGRLKLVMSQCHFYSSGNVFKPSSTLWLHNCLLYSCRVPSLTMLSGPRKGIFFLCTQLRLPNIFRILFFPVLGIRMFLTLQDPDLDPSVRSTDSDTSLFSFQRTEIMLAKEDLTQYFSKEIKLLGLKIVCLRVSYKKAKKHFFASIKSLKKGVGSGYVSQRYGSGSTPKH